MAYLYLVISICGELVGTSMLKASAGFTKLSPSIGVVLSYTFSFFFLSLSLKTIPLNIAYAIWSGLGTTFAVVISVLIWKEKLTISSLLGILLIISGVVILNLFGSSHERTEEATVKVSETL